MNLRDVAALEMLIDDDGLDASATMEVVEAELQFDEMTLVMTDVVGSLKADTQGRGRPRSGPFESDGEGG